MATGKAISLPMAIKAHLSLPGETATQLMQQIKKLTDQDKTDLRQWFGEIGIEVAPPTAGGMV